ncbi:MAG: hypothetical protein VB102_04465 [Paludibacter sp.]|nr:hypothetical protein [Paludibacter sp.]
MKSNFNRREILKLIASMGGMALLKSCTDLELPVPSAAKLPVSSLFEEQLSARKVVRRRTRRIIYNNDGSDVEANMDGVTSPEIFLNARTSWLEHSQVDTIFYATGVFNMYSHNSSLTEQPINNEAAMNAIRVFSDMDTDTLELMINCCRQQNKEIFWSMRMNDLRDATRPEMLSQFKKNNPGFLVATQGASMPYIQNKWSGLNYGVDVVRERAVSIVQDVITRYDLDGIELDFLRHPALFKAQFYGEQVTQQDCDKITQMILDIRNVCDIEGHKRGRPVLIAIKVPDSIPFNLAIGIDLERWLNESLVDLLITGDYFKLGRWEHWSALGRKYNLPVYAGMNDRRITFIPSTDDEYEKENEPTQIERWRGEAFMAWNGAVNGIYVCNRTDPHDSLFWELGDTRILTNLLKIRIVSYIGKEGSGYLDPGYWLANGRNYLNKKIS